MVCNFLYIISNYCWTTSLVMQKILIMWIIDKREVTEFKNWSQKDISCSLGLICSPQNLISSGPCREVVHACSMIIGNNYRVCQKKVKMVLHEIGSQFVQDKRSLGSIVVVVIHHRISRLSTYFTVCVVPPHDHRS